MKLESILTVYIIKVTLKILSQLSYDNTVTHLQPRGYKIG